VTDSPLRADDQDVRSLEAERLPRALVLLIPIAAAAAAVAGLHGELLCDDYPLLLSNSVHHIGDLLRPFLGASASAAAGGTYRPLAELSIGLDALLWGAEPFGFHLVNLLWHVINALLCYALVRVLVPPRPVVALTAALLFAVHPVHADALFWISARSDLVCTCFYLGSLILFVRGSGADRRRRPTVGSLLLFLCALLSKEVALSLPLVVVLLDLAAPATESFWRRARAHLPRYGVYLLVAAAYLALRLTVLPSLGRAHFPGLRQALFNFGLYLKLLLLPVETHAGLRGGVVLVLSVITVVVAFLRYARMGDRRNMLLAVAWTIIVLVPMIDVPRRFQLYLPSTGLCIFFGIVLGGLIWRRDADHPMLIRRASLVGLLLLLGGGAALLSYHATVYRRAGGVAHKIVEQVLRLTPPRADRPLLVANLPGVLTSWAGDQSIFAFGFPEALILASGRSELRSEVLSTLYIKDGEVPRPSIARQRDGSVRLAIGGGALGFSLHTREVTTGRDEVRVGQIVQTVGRRTTQIVRLEQGKILELRIADGDGPRPLLAWDGQTIVRVP
jgi:hypothetical protein